MEQHIIFTDSPPIIWNERVQIPLLQGNEWLVYVPRKRKNIRTCSGTNVCLTYFLAFFLFSFSFFSLFLSLFVPIFSSDSSLHPCFSSLCVLSSNPYYFHFILLASNAVILSLTFLLFFLLFPSYFLLDLFLFLHFFLFIPSCLSIYLFIFKNHVIYQLPM